MAGALAANWKALSESHWVVYRRFFFSKKLYDVRVQLYIQLAFTIRRPIDSQ